MPPSMTRSTRVWSLMWANESRSEVTITQFHPARTAQVAAEALTSSASSPSGVTVRKPSASRRAAARSSWSTSSGSFGRAPPCSRGSPARAPTRCGRRARRPARRGRTGRRPRGSGAASRAAPTPAGRAGRAGRSRPARGGCGGAARARPPRAAGGASPSPRARVWPPGRTAASPGPARLLRRRRRSPRRWSPCPPPGRVRGGGSSRGWCGRSPGPGWARPTPTGPRSCARR